MWEKTLFTMAAPPNVTTRAISGKYLLIVVIPQQDKSLNDRPDEVLRLQGVSWFKRRTFTLFSLTVRVKHAADETCVEHFVIDQLVSGIPALREVAVVNGQEQDKERFILGLVTTKSRGVAVEVITVYEGLRTLSTRHLCSDWIVEHPRRERSHVKKRTGECFVFAGRLVLTCPIRQTRHGASPR